ncbi:HNH endonuclease signature motif containing protein [Pseudomonas nitroreducens]|uniref:HNH endonuclease signature motif containing protein n=1 Tax=Pseudomonas nitroreducens TaxID=46680 RepID=UPI003AF288E2
MKAITSRPTKVCTACGSDFYRHPKDSESQWASRSYCSISCKNRSHESTPIHLRFWAHVDRKADDDCWEWTGSKDGHGYGTLSAGGGRPPQKAHRIAFEMAHGPIPAGLVVRHKCDNPGCVNPNHLEVGTQKDNSADMVARGRLNPISLLNLRPGVSGRRGAGPKSAGELHGQRS